MVRLSIESFLHPTYFFQVATYAYLFVYDSFDQINSSYLLFFVSKFSCMDIKLKEVYYK